MALDFTSLSVPGSLMWLGEHAVLEGAPAIVGAIDARMHLALHLRDDATFSIQSDLGIYEARLDEPGEDPRFTFILEAIRQIGFEGELSSGFDLHVRSEFSSTVGFGSSAAVTAGTVALLAQLRDSRAIFDRAVAVVRAVQGRGSGADVAASIYGGLIAYRADPVEIDPLRCEPPPISVIYCGYKTPTPEVIRHVAERREADPVMIASVMAKLGQIAGMAVGPIEANDWTMVGALMNMQHSLADTLGINTPELQTIVDGLSTTPGMHGAKITGAGLGDCAFGIGVAGVSIDRFETLPARVASEGLRIEA